MNLEILDDVSSTHDLVLDRMRAGAPHGTAILASRQSAGRGRRGRTWQSPQGAGLYLSVGFRHPGLAPRLSLLPLLAGLEVAELLDPTGSLGVRLKWPNDLLHSDRKLGGLLAEGTQDARGDRVVVLGIGLNLHTPTEGWPEAVRGRAIAADEAGLDLEEAPALARRLLHRLLQRVEQLATELPADWRARWRVRDATCGRRVRIDDDPGRRGEAIDIDLDGALLCRRDDGSIFRVVAGEITWEP